MTDPFGTAAIRQRVLAGGAAALSGISGAGERPPSSLPAPDPGDHVTPPAGGGR